MARSEKICWRPRFPLAGAYHCMSRSSHIVNAPRAFSAALYAFQFVVRYFVRFFLASLTASVYERSDARFVQQSPEDVDKAMTELGLW